MYFYMVIVIWLIVLVMRVRVPYKRYCEVCHNVLYCKYSVEGWRGFGVGGVLRVIR